MDKGPDNFQTSSILEHLIIIIIIPSETPHLYSLFSFKSSFINYLLLLITRRWFKISAPWPDGTSFPFPLLVVVLLKILALGLDRYSRTHGRHCPLSIHPLSPTLLTFSTFLTTSRRGPNSLIFLTKAFAPGILALLHHLHKRIGR